MILRVGHHFKRGLQTCFANWANITIMYKKFNPGYSTALWQKTRAEGAQSTRGKGVSVNARALFIF